ncbi:MAG TPA: CxxC-x17-CxxC domain-containing protein [Chloroflexia bacterium]|nr:CxxC-x17-CxxC domain-containing protein [Chloroflexia bacterium]
MADKTLTCRDCGTQFVFTEGEQDFYSQRGYTDPVRCPDCRASKKAARAGGGGGYGDSGYGDSYGGGRSGGGGYSSYGGGGGGGGGYGRSERTMTDVTCANCGKETQVPFVPRGDRPVYCSDCFSSVGGGGGGGRSNSRY